MYYKITNLSNQSVIESTHCVQYSTHHWVRGLGKLFVFETFKDVLNFSNVTGGSLRNVSPVWACEIYNPKPLLFMADDVKDYERFWKSFPNYSVPVLKAPQGTVVVDSVKLLEQIC